MAEEKKGKSSSALLKQNVALNMAFRVLMIIAPFLTTPYVSRVLTSGGVGVYSYTISLVSYFSMFAALGTSSYGAREIARKRDDPKEYSKTFWEIEMISVICSVVSLAGWLVFASLYEEYRVYMYILSFCILATTLDISWLYAGLEKYKYTISINFLFKVLSVLAIFLFVKKPTDIWIYVLIYTLSQVLGSGSMWVFLPKVLTRAKIDRHSLKGHFKETLIYFIPTIASSIYTVLDKTLIGALLQGETTVMVNGVEESVKISEVETGYYEQATRILDMAKTLAFASVNAVVCSRASYLYGVNATEEVKKLTIGTFHFVTFLSVGVAFGIVGIADTFVPLFFGQGYEKTIILLQIMAFFVPIICVSGTLGSVYYTPIGKRKQSSIYLVIGALVNLVISAPLVIFYKSIGAAIATIIAEVLVGVLYFIFCKKALTFRELIDILWRKILAGGIMLGAIILCNHFLRPLIPLPIVYLFVSIAIGLGLYLLILFLLRDGSITAFLGFVKNLIGKKGNINAASENGSAAETGHEGDENIIQEVREEEGSDRE